MPEPPHYEEWNTEELVKLVRAGQFSRYGSAAQRSIIDELKRRGVSGVDIAFLERRLEATQSFESRTRAIAKRWESRLRLEENNAALNKAVENNELPAWPSVMLYSVLGCYVAVLTTVVLGALSLPLLLILRLVAIHSVHKTARLIGYSWLAAICFELAVLLLPVVDLVIAFSLYRRAFFLYDLATSLRAEQAVPPDAPESAARG